LLEADTSIATMPADPSGGTVIQKVAVARKTNYASGLWMKG